MTQAESATRSFNMELGAIDTLFVEDGCRARPLLNLRHVADLIATGSSM